MNESLLSLVTSKRLAEDILREDGGEITESNDLIWQEKSLALKDKLDAYGFVFTEFDSQEAKLKYLKDKMQSISKRIEKARASMKARLNYISEGNVLKGNIFSFHPFMTTHTIIADPSQLKSDEIYLTIEIRKDWWEELLLDKSFPYEIKKEGARISDLPDNHPALSISHEPSVRIT